MRLHPRAIAPLIAAGLCFAAVWAPMGVAERFSDKSGLDSGAFVWQPGAAPRGTVLIVASLGQQSVQVYRGGALLGMVRLTEARRADLPTGVFAVSSDAMGRSFIARPLHVSGAGPARVQPLRLPADFSRLLAQASAPSGALLVIAQDRSEVRLLPGGGGVLGALMPLPRASEPVVAAKIETGSVADADPAPPASGAPAVAGWTRSAAAVADVAAQNAPQIPAERPRPDPAEAVVISLADRKLVARGEGPASSGVDVQLASGGAAAGDTGTHVFVHAGETTGQDGPRWLALSLGVANDAHLETWRGEADLAAVELAQDALVPRSGVLVVAAQGLDSGAGIKRAPFVALATAPGMASEPGDAAPAPVKPVTAAPSTAVQPVRGAAKPKIAAPVAPAKQKAAGGVTAARVQGDRPFGPDFFAIH